MRIGSRSTRANFFRVDIYPLCRTNIYPSTKANKFCPDRKLSSKGECKQFYPDKFLYAFTARLFCFILRPIKYDNKTAQEKKLAHFC